MHLKLIAVFSLFFLLIVCTTKSTLASEKPSSEITPEEEVYADLALRNELQDVSVYYFDDNTANTISLNAEKDWVPASTIKLFAAMYAYDQAAAGNISLDQTVTIADNNVAASLSDPNGYPPLMAGDTATVYRLVDQMITQSDNTSFNTLLDLLDRRQITKYIHDLGLVNSSVGGKLNLDDTQQAAEAQNPGYGINVTTADDYAKAFILINGGRIPGSAGLFNILSRQKLNSMIPALLPKDVVVAHKTGELDPYYHDGGIVVAPNRKYILSVFSDVGNPDIVAHISDLVYTKDINMVGSNPQTQPVSSEPLPPIDPLVLSGQVQDTNVLAESTQNIKVPAITASDLGIKSQDLSSALNPNELPKIMFPADSPLHFLVDWADKLASLNPIPSLRIMSQANSLKLKLAESSDLISKGKIAEGKTILKEVGTTLQNLAREKDVSQNVNLQSALDEVSQTRFVIFKNTLAKQSTTDKIQTLKTIAGQAKDTAQNINPYITESAKSKDLSQKPILGQVVRTTPTSITVKASDGDEVTSSLDTLVAARNASDIKSKLVSPSEIPVGSTVALVGGNSNNKIKPSFILTNISIGNANPKVVTVLKVNLDTNTMVVAGNNGVPVQVDLTKDSVIKGIDTKISLNEVKKGDVVVLRGEQISPATGQPSPSATPQASGNTSNQTGQAQQNTGSTPSQNPAGQNQPTQPSGTSSPSQNQQKTAQPQNTSTQKQAAPISQKGGVIKGSVIQVVEKSSEKKSPKQKEEKKPVPNPIPPATPAESDKKK